MNLDRSEGPALVSWGEGPLVLWRAGMQVIGAWQRVWLDNVSRTQGLFKVWPAASEKALAPWSDLAGRWNGRADTSRLAGADTPAKKAIKAVPGKTALAAVPAQAKPEAETSSSERQAIEAAIAAKQGVSSPKLGCLDGVEVVGGPAAAAPVVETKGTVDAASEAAPGSVTSMLAMQAKSLARAVRSPRQKAVETAGAGKSAVKAAAPTKAGSAAKVAKTPVVVVAKAPAKKLGKPSAKARQAG